MSNTSMDLQTFSNQFLRSCSSFSVTTAWDLERKKQLLKKHLLFFYKVFSSCTDFFLWLLWHMNTIMKVMLCVCKEDSWCFLTAKTVTLAFSWILLKQNLWMCAWWQPSLGCVHSNRVRWPGPILSVTREWKLMSDIFLWGGGGLFFLTMSRLSVYV